MNYVDMEWHEAAELLPLMGREELDQLAQDIKTSGLRAPIVLLGGAILDGRNRHRACQIAGVEPRFVYANLQEIGDPFVYVASLNLHRRHLNESQRALVGARLKEHFAALAKERQREAAVATNSKLGHGSGPLLANLPEASRNARDDAASLVNVSPRSVESAARVLERGAPELVAAVERGDVAVSAAAEVARLPQELQAQVVGRGEVAAVAKAQREARKRDLAPVTEAKQEPAEPESYDWEDGPAEVFDASESQRREPSVDPAQSALGAVFEPAQIHTFTRLAQLLVEAEQRLRWFVDMPTIDTLDPVKDRRARQMLEGFYIKTALMFFERVPEEAQPQRPSLRVIDGGGK